MIQVRIWDWPTRIFHWTLAILIVALVITGNVGGNAMVWHFRFGYMVFTLVAFRGVDMGGTVVRAPERWYTAAMSASTSRSRRR